MVVTKKYIILLLLLSVGPVWAQTATEIIKKSDEARMPGNDLSVDVHVRDFKNGKLDKETSYKAWIKPPLMSLVETTSPARQKGRKLLMVNNDLWFFSPDIRRPARISFQQRLTGEIANGDLARTNFLGDYLATISGTEKVKDQMAWVLDLKAANKDVTYASIKYWVAKDSFMPIKAEFYAISGKLIKRAVYSDPKNILGGTRITTVLIQDAIQTTNQSIIRYDNYRRENLNESFFNKDNIAP